MSFLKNHESQWYLLGLFLLVVLVFSNSLFFGFVWDDNVLLVGQESYQSVNFTQLLFSPVNGVEYLPLRDLTYIIDYKIWGWNPFGFHLTNLILYILNIWAVYRFTLVLNTTLIPLDGQRKTNDNVWVATITAASGLKPALRHLMLKNFSAPRSAPKPASVTT